MSQFEYVTVLTSFVVAFGVSELLAGFGRQVLERATTRPDPLQIAASLLLLIALLQSLWGYWGFRDVAWGFGHFLLALSPLLSLVGAAYLIMPRAAADGSGLRDPRAHYHAVAPAIFALLAVWVALGTVVELALVDTSLHLGQGVRVAALVLFAGLSRTSRRGVHAVGLAVLAILQLSFAVAVTPTLG